MLHLCVLLISLYTQNSGFVLSNEAAARGVLVTDIHSIDWSNRRYRLPSELGGGFALLRRGKSVGGKGDLVGLGAVRYSDVTGDRTEEAIVVLGISSGGSATFGIVYVYSLDRAGLKSLWTFVTGDRAHGGLRRVYGEKGYLIVELYGENRIIGGDLSSEKGPACCPSHYTEARYKWIKGRFELVGSPRVMKNADNNASFRMR